MNIPSDPKTTRVYWQGCLDPNIFIIQRQVQDGTQDGTELLVKELQKSRREAWGSTKEIQKFRHQKGTTNQKEGILLVKVT